MMYRWCRPGQPSASANFATKEQARDNAVFNAMMQDSRTQAGKVGSERFKRLTDDQKALIWRSLERAGWRVEMAA